MIVTASFKHEPDRRKIHFVAPFHVSRITHQYPINPIPFALSTPIDSNWMKTKPAESGTTP